MFAKKTVMDGEKNCENTNNAVCRQVTSHSTSVGSSESLSLSLASPPPPPLPPPPPPIRAASEEEKTSLMFQSGLIENCFVRLVALYATVWCTLCQQSCHSDLG